MLLNTSAREFAHAAGAVTAIVARLGARPAQPGPALA